MYTQAIEHMWARYHIYPVVTQQISSDMAMNPLLSHDQVIILPERCWFATHHLHNVQKHFRI